MEKKEGRNETQQNRETEKKCNSTLEPSRGRTGDFKTRLWQNERKTPRAKKTHL